MTHLVVRQEDGWAPGHSADDTFTHIFPGARAVHRRVRLIRAAVAQSGLTLECAWHVDAAEKQTFLQATLDDNKRRFGKGKYIFVTVQSRGCAPRPMSHFDIRQASR